MPVTIAHPRARKRKAILLRLVIFLLAQQAIPMVGLAQQVEPEPRTVPVESTCSGEESVADDHLLFHCPATEEVAAAQSDDDDQAVQSIVPGPYLQQSSERKRNMTAADLQPGWNDLNALSTAAGFTSLTTDQAGTARKNIFSRLRTAYADTEGPKTPLQNVPLQAITILGERNGITYGTWKSGPAGTLPIKLYYGSHDITSRSKPSKDFRAVLRRSAKIWSKRLVDDGQRHDVTLLDGSGTTLPDGTPVLDGTKVKNVHGVLIQLRLNNRGMNSARVLGYKHDKDKNIYRPTNGRVRISLSVHDHLHDGMVQTVAHEIGHVLGIARKGTDLFKQYYDSEAHTWNGPNAKAQNGGKPVPLQWRSKDQWWVVKKPNEPDAVRDPGHIGLCVSIMAYCNDRYIGGSPSELDFAFLADIGFTLVDANVAAQPERYGHLSWGEWAVWGASVERDLRNNFHETPHDFVQAHATAFGAAPAMTIARNPALSGTVAWNGSLVGVDLGVGRQTPVVGKAELSVNLATLSGTARFSDLIRHVNGNNVLKASGRIKPFRQSQLSYAIDVTGNNFADGDSRISGSFYGPSHQEMAGVLNDVRPEVNLLAGFGGVRVDE